MGRTSLFTLATALVVTSAAAPALADEPTDPRIDPRTFVAETWTAMGSTDAVSEEGFRDTEFVFVTGVLGLARFAPFEVGVSFDLGGGEDAHVMFGPVVGVGFDLVPGLRAEGLLQFGGHLIDGIGWGDPGTVGDDSAWLAQGGLRLGLSGRLGRETPRIVVGGWVALFRDFGTETRTLAYPDGGGSEVWEIGGAMGLLAVRLGFEW